MSWFSLTLITTILSSINSLFDKFFCEKKFKNVLSYLLLGNFLQIGYFFLLFLKADYKNATGLPLLLTLISGPIFLLMWVANYQGLKTVEVSRAAAIFNINIIFSTLLAIILLNEKLTSLKLLAIILIFIGASLCSYENDKAKKNQVIQSGYLFIILSALISSVGGTLTKYATGKIFPLTVYFLSSLSGLPIFLASLFKKEIFEEFKMSLKNKRIILPMFLNRTLAFIAVCFYYLAVSKGPISLITAILVGVSPMLIFLFSTFLSFFFPKIIKEKITKEVLVQKLVAIGLIVGGVVIINR